MADLDVQHFVEKHHLRGLVPVSGERQGDARAESQDASCGHLLSAQRQEIVVLCLIFENGLNSGISEVPSSKYRLVLSLLCLDKASELEVELPTVSFLLKTEAEPKKKKLKAKKSDK